MADGLSPNMALPLGYFVDQYLAVVHHPDFDLSPISPAPQSSSQTPYVGGQGASRGGLTLSLYCVVSSLSRAGLELGLERPPSSVSCGPLVSHTGTDY
ncbi:hypothetical protein CABS01_08742 [Colletotrichum abscissum]|uniref:uncharacterized protein n=1 Tax=Colletotrichum abscissum TaxID=1671311 RepID=UPI0027D50C1E|nr:uncharacterized protein CABS01_08742 [Colletotrichum abscissum]KAK1504964.1 hypothetical protein CABS01_08742 [Colletotrichum abscissum]